MKFSINNEVFINLTNSFGHIWSVQQKDLQKYQKHILNAAEEVRNIRSAGKGPAGELVLFPHLPYILDESLLMTDSERDKLDKLDILAKRQDAVISIGIGGSYLGNQALFDIFCQLPDVFGFSSSFSVFSSSSVSADFITPASTAFNNSFFKRSMSSVYL